MTHKQIIMQDVKKLEITDVGEKFFLKKSNNMHSTSNESSPQRRYNIPILWTPLSVAKAIDLQHPYIAAKVRTAKTQEEAKQVICEIDDFYA